MRCEGYDLELTPVWDLLYRMDPAVWGRGIATEAASAALGDVLQRRPGRMVIARVRPAHHARAAVAIKARSRRAPELDAVGESLRSGDRLSR